MAKRFLINRRLKHNNYRKLHGYVKFSRYWKPSSLIKLKTEDMIAAFGSVEELNRMLDYIESTALSEMDRHYNNYLRRRYRDRD